MNIVGLDLGAGALKVINGEGPQMTLSQVALNGQAQYRQDAFGLDSAKRPLHIAGQFGSFYVGDGAHNRGTAIERLDVDRFVDAPDMRALVYAGLHRVRKDEPISLVIGLPQNIAVGEKATDNIAAVKAWMTGQHNWEADGKKTKLEVASVVATSQPRGAYMDALLNDRGQLRSDRKDWKAKEIGIISIGFNTLELLVLDAGTPVEKYTASETVGAHSLLSQCNPGGHYTLGQLDTKLRNGGLDTSKAIGGWYSELMAKIHKTWKTDYNRFAAVVLVGGGAILLEQQLRAKFGELLVMDDDPVMAVARGLYKFGLSKYVKTA